MQDGARAHSRVAGPDTQGVTSAEAPGTGSRTGSPTSAAPTSQAAPSRPCAAPSAAWLHLHTCHRPHAGVGGQTG